MVKVIRFIATFTLLYLHLNQLNGKFAHGAKFALIEGDMMVETPFYKLARRTQKRGAVLNSGKHNFFWEASKDSEGNRIIRIPYKLRFTAGFFSRIFGGENKAEVAFKRAAQYFHHYTCIRFKEMQTTDEDYIDVFQGTGCWAQIGRRDGKQQVSIGSGCEYLGKVVHELMHVLGFFHEQSRTDRDEHVKILYQNIQEGKSSEFNNYKQNTDGLPYDFHSIMHYTKKHFTKNGKNTIEAKTDPSMQLGNDEGFSPLDVVRINQLYRCPELKRNLVKYPITVYTSTAWYSGTNGIVDVILVGTRGDCGEIVLGPSPTITDPFERGSKETFPVVCPVLGELTELKIRLTKAGWFGTWKLAKVEVESPGDKKRFLFKHNKWIYNGDHITLKPERRK